MDNFQLQRFVDAQTPCYSQVISELRNADKQSHWMWFIFPQIAELGSSETSKKYAIKNIAEARAYLSHPILGARLQECCELVMDIEAGSISEAMGFPDDVKLKSSMTMFAYVAGLNSIFDRVLEKHFASQPDVLTLEIIAEMGE
jgi:uncharacterized protein (DUF1810 family)